MAEKKTPPVRLAYLVNQPIQYQAPLLRLIAKEPSINLKVFFRSDFSVKAHIDPEFKTEIQWDVDMLNGYDYDFLPAWGTANHISFWYPLNFGLLKMLKEAKIKILWLHGYTSLFSIITIVVAKINGIKVLLRDEANFISKKRGYLKRIAKRITYFGLNCFSDGFLAIGTLNKQYYLENGIPSEKIFPMPYAVDNVFFQKQPENYSGLALRETMGLEPGRPIVLFAGKLIARKGPFELVEAFRQVVEKITPRPYLILVGEGELKSELKEYAIMHEIEKDVFFTGFMNQKELTQLYHLCDLFVLPSRFEPWGLVVNEVMNAGKAVITSDQVGSSKDLVQPGINGYIYKTGDVGELSSAIGKVFTNRAKYQEMGLASLKIISNWSFEQDIDGLRQAIKSMANNIQKPREE